MPSLNQMTGTQFQDWDVVEQPTGVKTISTPTPPQPVSIPSPIFARAPLPQVNPASPDTVRNFFGTNASIPVRSRVLPPTSIVTSANQKSAANLTPISVAVATPTTPITVPTTVQGFAAVPHEWINQISSSGVPFASRPFLADLGDSASIALKPGASDHIQYVSPNGNDSNDGLSWGSAKLTASAAFSAIGSNQGFVHESPALSSDGIAGTGSATGLNGIIIAPQKIYVGPSAQATSGTTGVDSGQMRWVGSVWNGTQAVDDFWEIHVNAFSGAFSAGSNLEINHSSVENGSGRVLVGSDFVISNPRDATPTLNSNSFAFDNQGGYYDGGPQQMLWEMANTVNGDGLPLSSTIFRQNWVPVFNSAAVGVQAEYALGGSGTLGVSGNYSGPPKWLWTNLRGSSFNTMSLEHSATALRTITFPDATGTLFLLQGSAGQVQFNNGADANFFWDNANKRLGIGTSVPSVNVDIKTTGTGAFPQLLIENGAAGGGTAYIGLTDSGNGAGGNKFLISSSTSSTGAFLAIDFTNGRLGVGTASPAFGLDVNGTINTNSGYRISGGATSGHVLRGNGTAFVDAALAAADLSNGVTGSGAVVLANAPTFTGAPTVPGIVSNGNIQANTIGTATSGSNFGSNALQLFGSWWNGSAAVSENWSISAAPASTIPNPQRSFFTLQHSSGIPNARVQLSDNNPATAVANFSAPDVDFIGHYWNGTASAVDETLLRPVLGSGTNPTCALTLTHVGTSGTFTVDFTAASIFKTTIVQPGSGTVSAPSLSFSTETNSGWYRAGAGDFRFAVAGNDHCRIEAGDFTISTNDLFRWGSGGVTGADTAFSRVSAGVVALGNASAVGDSTGTLQLKRLKATGGTALAAANFTLTGWGSTATIGSIAGTDAAFTFLVTSNGTGQVTNPNVRITFADGTWTNTPIIVVCGLQGNASVCQWEVQAPTATSALLVFLGTPSAAGTYGANVIVIGR